MQTRFRPLLFLWLSITLVQGAHAQATDTVRLSIGDVETLFLKSNYQLLLKQYDIRTAQAGIITARLFDNPQVSFENVLYNPDTRKVFDLSHNGGQYQAQVAQIFRLAGKRNKSIRLAESGATLPEYEFGNLLRTLRYTLRSDFYKIFFQQRSIAVYDREISSLQTILNVFREQYSKGNVAQKEVLRIQSLLYTLQGEQSALYGQLQDAQAELRLLTATPTNKYLLPQVDSTLWQGQSLTAVAYGSLLDSAVVNRSDLKEAAAAVNYAGLNLALQRSLAVPDLTVSATYDKQGSFIRNYNGLGVSIPIPVFNRNQGGIQQARLQTEASHTAEKSVRLLVENEVGSAYESAMRLEKLYGSMDPAFGASFNHLIEEVGANYARRNISLLEFLDFYDSYKSNAIQLNNLLLDRLTAFETINFVTETPFFNKVP